MLQRKMIYEYLRLNVKLEKKIVLRNIAPIYEFHDKLYIIEWMNIPFKKDVLNEAVATCRCFHKAEI